jgi:hypothetical protein
VEGWDFGRGRHCGMWSVGLGSIEGVVVLCLDVVGGTDGWVSEGDDVIVA